MKRDTIPIWEKLNLTIDEAVAYSNIGKNTLIEVLDKNINSNFILYIGRKRLIKRKEFETWLSKQYIIK